MNEQPEIITHLKNALIQQRLNFKTLMEILESELDAVKNRNGDKLLEVASKKEALLSEINKIDQSCNTEQFLPYLKENQELAELRAEINEALVQCQQKMKWYT